MFTGIITDIGKIVDVIKNGDTRITFKTEYDTSTIDFGASISCSGACLTVVDKSEDQFSVDVSEETLSCTTLGRWSNGSVVNLERSIKVGEELGGHLVTGHVDAIAEILSIKKEGDSKKFTFLLPNHLKKFVAAKGSITLNGASLTVNEINEDGKGRTVFGVNIIPHTQEKTTFGSLTEGEFVNVEIDILARYVARMREVD